MKGKYERKGRQKKRWDDNIKKWTGRKFDSSTRAAEDRIRWLVVLCLTALSDSISVYIGSSPRERETKERTRDERQNV